MAETTQRDLDLTKHIDNMLGAVRASGPLTGKELRDLMDAVRRDPNAMPPRDDLWPIFSYIRICVIQQYPEEWFDPAVLRGAAPRAKIKNASTHPEANLVEREEAIHQYLKELHRVCPFAKLAAQRDEIQYFGLEKGFAQDTEARFATIQKAFLEFLNNGGEKRVFILVLEDNFENHTEAHVVLKRAFLELAIVATHRAWPNVELARLRVAHKKINEKALNNPDTPLQDLLVEFKENLVGSNGVKPEDLLFIFNGHHFHTPDHGRYLPFPAVVVTYSEDIARAVKADPRTRTAITEKALAGAAIDHFPVGTTMQYVLNGMTGFYDGEDDRIMVLMDDAIIPPDLQAVLHSTGQQGFHQDPIVYKSR